MSFSTLTDADRRVWTALALRQWLAVRGLHTAFLVAWLTALWVLQLVAHPGWMIAFGLLYTVLVTPLMAGADILDGTEEFSFALPPGRQALFLTRMGIGLAFLLVTTGLGSLAIACDMPQAVWSLVATSGITAPNPPVTPSFLYALAVLVPVAAFAGTFTLASLAGSRALVGFSWVLSAAAVGGIVFASLMVEAAIWEKPVGWITCVALLLGSVLTLLGGSLAYADKEAVIGGGRAGTRWGTGVVVAILLVVTLFMLSVFWFFTRAVQLDRATQIQAADRASSTLLETVDP
jgi:hypothetical protein